MKVVKVLIFVSGLTIILVVLSINLFPKWFAIPGGLLVLASVAFNWVLDAGNKTKGWIELLEKKGTFQIEDKLQRNLNLKRRIEEDFSDWLNYFPEKRKRNSKMLLRSYNDKQYPDSNKPDKYGEYPWFAAEIKSLYHSGIEFIYGAEELAIFDDNKWDFNNYGKSKNLATITALRVGKVNYSDIVDYDLKGDEYYPFPHFFCRFAHKGLPFEETYFESVDEKPPIFFEYKDKKL